MLIKQWRVLQIFTTTQALDYIGSRIKTPKGYGSHHLPLALPHRLLLVLPLCSVHSC